jgi:hypothetical protein
MADMAEAMMRKKQTEEPDTILDPTYWHLLPEKQRCEAQKELEDTLEAALDEGEPVEADDQFWNSVHARLLANVEGLEAAKKKNAKG